MQLILLTWLPSTYQSIFIYLKISENCITCDGRSSEFCCIANKDNTYLRQTSK